MNDSGSLRLEIGDEQELVSLLSPLLQKGVGAEATTGKPVLFLLIDEFGLSREYVKQNIQTVFLNGSPVDDLQSTVVRTGDTVALSAAMPGLVGAILRSSSPLAGMRTAVQHTDSDEQEAGRGQIIVKLFNTLIYELGSLFLKRGVLTEGSEVASLLSGAPQDFWEKVGGVRLNGRDIQFQEQSLKEISSAGMICLQVKESFQG